MKSIEENIELSNFNPDFDDTIVGTYSFDKTLPEAYQFDTSDVELQILMSAFDSLSEPVKE